MAYCTAYMESYRSPHESPSCSFVLLKAENKKLRRQNTELALEITRLRSLTSFQRKRPAKLDLGQSFLSCHCPPAPPAPRGAPPQWAKRAGASAHYNQYLPLWFNYSRHRGATTASSVAPPHCRRDRHLLHRKSIQNSRLSCPASCSSRRSHSDSAGTSVDFEY